MPSIRKNKTYGDYKAVKKIDEGFFGCICLHCKKKKKIREKILHLQPECKDCKVKIARANKKSKSLTVYLGKEINTLGVSKEFRSSLVEINSLLNSSTQDGIKKFQISALETVLELIPFAEDTYRKKPNINTSATLTTLINQARDLASDLSETKKYNTDMYEGVIKILHPAFLQVGEIIVNNAASFNKAMISDPSLDDKDKEHIEKKLNQTFIDIGGSVENLFYEARKDLINYMLGSK